MCPEFERVERIVRRAVDGCEKVVGADGVDVVSQERMVKRFRRSAAGDEAQLPSDVRPPVVLKVRRRLARPSYQGLFLTGRVENAALPDR